MTREQVQERFRADFIQAYKNATGQTLTLNPADPVSYTHLDVYKRQDKKEASGMTSEHAYALWPKFAVGDVLYAPSAIAAAAMSAKDIEAGNLQMCIRDSCSCSSCAAPDMTPPITAA